MMSLFFEVEIKPGRTDQYLNLAASLKPELDSMGGCLFLDRFKSLSRDNLILSYQIWQDEGSMTAWRVHAYHHDVQTLGRDRVFSDYRIRRGASHPRSQTWAARLADGAADHLQ